MNSQKLIFNIILITLLTFLSSSCGEKMEGTVDFPEPPGIGSLVTPVKDKPVMLCVDASANFSRFVEKENIVKYLTLAKEAGFTDILLDIRPTSGEVLYKGSKYADEITEWKGVTRDASWDYFEYFIEQTHKLGMRIYASMNVFTAGQNILKRGMAYNDPEVRKMVAQIYTNTGMSTGFDNTEGVVFLNPAMPEAQEYILNVAKEIVTKYDMDGIMYDRCRYNNRFSDYSELSGKLFADYVKKTYDREGIKFPEDVLSYDAAGNPVWGIYEKIWYEWRSMVISDFFFKSRDELKAIKPDLKFITYTGGWYTTYYEMGSNWASSQYDPSSEFPLWANSRYMKTGFAEALDYHLAGVYYDKLAGDGWWTISGGLKNIQRINCGACPVVASLAPEKFASTADRPLFQEAVTYCMLNSGGVMIFDLYHVDMLDYWDVIKSGIDDALKHDER